MNDYTYQIKRELTIPITQNFGVCIGVTTNTGAPGIAYSLVGKIKF